MTIFKKALVSLTFATALFAGIASGPATTQELSSDRYTQEEILTASKDFFGATTAGLAEIVQKVFDDYGQPNAYITGEEASGAIGVGLRYGNGYLNRKTGEVTRVYWQGPSIGFDVGGNASRVFTLIYNLGPTYEIFQRFPGVEGTFYFVGGVGVNYQQSEDIILAPIRTGVGLRAGANIGYLHYNDEHSWWPF